MTSTANPQNPNQAPTTAAPSYASAASASKKSGNGANNIVASGSHPPSVVVGSSGNGPSSGQPKTASVSPANGRTSVPPALPVVHGSSSANGGAGDHARKPSVTISANGPPSYSANGGPVGNSKSSIQFGYNDSPGVSHSTPQAGSASPVPIPGTGHARVASPAQSPSPIPQPTASGGRPPSGLQQSGDVKPSFGSFNNDPERHMRQAIPPNNFQNQSFQHTRQGSNISMASTGDMGNQGMPGPNRGGFHHGGRGRGFNNPNNPPYNNPHNPATGYPPPASYRNGHGQGRNSMAPSFQSQPPQQRGYANSPQPNRGSPALVPSNPITPNMVPAMPAPNTPQFYQPAMAAQQQNMAGYSYPAPGPMNHYAAPMGHNPYATYPMHYPGQSGSPAYGPGYGTPPYHGGPAAMTPSLSQSEKPNYGSGPNNQPVVVSTPQMSHAQAKAPVVAGSGSSVSRPAKKAIVIKRPDGGIVDVGNIKTSSPTPSRTPPVVSSTATPPAKPSTPAHIRSESVAPPKTKEEIQEELRTKIAEATGQAAGSSTEAAKVDEAGAAVAAKKKADAEQAKKDAEEKTKAEEKAKVDAEEAAKQEAEAKVKADAAAAAGAKAKQEAEEKAKKDAEEAKKVAPAPASDDPDEDEMERIIREMEEEDARREAEEEEHRVKSDAAKKIAKEAADKQAKIDSAENDKKLREAEREMERLEEEKERKAKENAAAGTTVAELMARESKVESVTEKLAGVNLDDSNTSAAAKARKPAALNLALNTKPVEAPQPSAALQSLKSSRFLTIKEASNPALYSGTALASPNPAVNAAVGKKGQSFKYDAAFLLQFQPVFTEQPSEEFQSQIKSLIGDAEGPRSGARTPSTRQSSSRGTTSFPGPIGAFINPRSMPPPSGPPPDRMGMAGGSMPRTGMGALQFGGQGAGRSFPGSPLIGGRQPSASGGRHDSRQGSRPGGGRSGSHRHGGGGYNAGKESQQAKTMPLTQGMDLKPIQVTATGWKPNSIVNKGQQQAGSHMEPEMVQRKVKAALNKMTPENFDKISDQILTIANQSKNENDGRTLRQVIQLTFEKATDESHFSLTYAKFCKRMLDQMSPDIKDDAIKDKHGSVVSGGNLFRKYLLNRCQEEFEKGWSIQESADGNSKAPGAELLSDEYYVAAAVKRKGLGLVRFIGELFKLGMLTERIIHGCVRQLVDYKDEPKEAEIESLTYLLKTVGSALDSSDKGRPMMDAYFQRIQNMIDIPDLEKRLKFMLMDVRDMRNDRWKAVEVNKGPLTLEEVRIEAERVAAAKAMEAARGPHRGGGGPRMAQGRGDARSFSHNYAQVNNTVGMDDLKRLKSNSRMPSSGMSLGPQSMLASRSNSGRRPGGPGGSLGRSGDNSGMSSRTGTPPTRESSNAFGLLAMMDAENPASPPSVAATPAQAKANADAAAAAADKKTGA